MQSNALKISVVSAGALIALALAGTVSAQLVPNACQQTDPPHDNVDITGGSTTCDTATEMCCEINNGGGASGDYCDASSPPVPGFPQGKKMRVHSEILPNGAVNWRVDRDPTLTNVFPDGNKTIGASGGSNCVYFNEPDLDKASGAGYVKNNGNYSGVQRVIFFSDGVNEVAEQPLPVVPNCEFGEGGTGFVADVAVTCPTGGGANGANERWIIVAEVRDDQGNKNSATLPLLGFIDPLTGDIDPTNFCKCNKGDTAQGEDEQCNPNIRPARPVGCDPEIPGDCVFPGDPKATEGPYADLPACTLEEALPTPVVIELQNPTCVGAGSSRRCW